MRNRFRRSVMRLLQGHLPDSASLWPFSRPEPAKPARPRRRRQAAPPVLAAVADFGSNPGNLSMFAHIPEGLPAGRPLVLVLHGCRQDAASYDRAAGWSTLAEERGFAVVYAEQKRSNNPGLCFTWFRPSEVTRDRGELMSIRQMVAHAADLAASDAGRIFVTGLSAGGAMAAAALANYPDVFAGGAVIAGLPFGAARDATRAFEAMAEAPGRSAREWGDLVRAAVPDGGRRPAISIWHGTADDTVALSNAAALVEQWRDLHRLPEEAFVEKRTKSRRTRVWPDGEGRALVSLTEIEGLGHGTPVTRGAGGGFAVSDEPFMLEAGFSSTREIARTWGITRRWRR
ncbi:extracellular catalytic domain type 1 short-chain-length polyhydroxyalkanoate depolymerase [Shinella pollutisoli]|uniref:Alpha/beta hydrolase family esterase n=1 Tax=Shinella pollutisoli TaxID=2250594 RepID=A0ABV7DML7_9HYPH|nr:PHB depolymerase family esterase [Shinella pollutisoli]